MIAESDSAKAEKLSRKRARSLPIFAVIFISQQAAFFAGFGQGDRTVDNVQVGAWLGLSIVLLLFLATGGGWIYSRAVRDLANDESTRAHRNDAFRVGFLSAMAGCIVLYVLSLIEPLTGREAVHLVMTIGIAAALVRFGFLERRALMDG
jgi:hypothetical protein